MKVAVFSTKGYDRQFFDAVNEAQTHGHQLTYFEPHLNAETVPLAAGFEGVCVFVNDLLSAAVLGELAAFGVRLIALRCAGFNNVDISAAHALNLTVARVPAYSPHAVAEHTAGLILTLNRNLHRAYNRVREGNFALGGLLGFDLNGRTVGIIGTGKIGVCVARIMLGFGCRVLAHDPYPNPEVTTLGGIYVELPQLLSESDIVTLHCPLTPQTHHLIDEAAINRMRPGAMLINTSRGPLVDTLAVIEALKSGQLGYVGLDVYEEEADLFFEDLSGQVIQDDVFARLLTFPNVIITGHQAFFTQNALRSIAETTLCNITDFEQSAVSAENEVTVERLVR